jgi:bifunctional non-homologous end joining protein LigD
VKIVPALCERDVTNGRILDDPAFIFELKLDGVRIVAEKIGDKVTLTYRKIRDATRSYPEIVDAMSALGEERLVLDGEICAFDEHGRPDFERLGTRIQSWGKDARRKAYEVPVMYVVFDVIAVGERDVRALPIEERKAILEKVVPAGSHLRVHPTFDTGRPLMDLCREHRLEGVVAKRRGSKYRAGERTKDWIKVKCSLDADFVVVGWTEGDGTRSGAIGALDLAAYDDDGVLVARGSVGSGLDGDTIDFLLDRLRPIEVKKPVVEKGRLVAKRGRHFTKPELVVSVRYTGITGEGLMRHPVFRGVREDLRPDECRVVGPISP